MTSRAIVFVDDEPVRLRPWQSSLAARGLDVRLELAPERLPEVLEDPGVGFVFLDIQMPTPHSLSVRETQLSTRTGLVLLERLDRRRWQDKLAVFTNVADADVRTRVQELGFPYLRRDDCPPDALWAFLRERGLVPEHSGTTSPSP